MAVSNKVLLDTNFLLIPATKGIDIFEEINNVVPNAQFHILDRTIDELNNIITKQSGKHKNAAKMGLQLIKAKKIQILKSDSTDLVDDIIVSMQDDYLIATQDKGVKDRLRKCLILRQEKYVQLVEK